MRRFGTGARRNNHLDARRSERGAAMVEFAIILPVLIILVFGIIEFSRAYNAKITLTHAAREGAREYVLTQDAVQGEQTARDNAVGLDPGQVNVSLSGCVVGNPTTVTVTYPFQLSIPFFSSSPLTLAGEATMRCGG